MEEDTRSYHRFHPFPRRHPRRRAVSVETKAIPMMDDGVDVAEAVAATTTSAASTAAPVSSGPRSVDAREMTTTMTSRWKTGDGGNNAKRSAGAAFGSDPPDRRRRRRHRHRHRHNGGVVPPEFASFPNATTTTVDANRNDESDRTMAVVVDVKRLGKATTTTALGMTAIDEPDATTALGGSDGRCRRSLSGLAVDNGSNRDSRLPPGSIRHRRNDIASSAGDGNNNNIININNNINNNGSGNGSGEPEHRRPRPPGGRRCAAAAVAVSRHDDRTSLIEETRRLFEDYRRRFHRQSLTDRARELFDRAGVLARRTTTTETDDDERHRRKQQQPYQRRQERRDGVAGRLRDDDDAPLPASVAAAVMLTEALALCRTAVTDQEATMTGTAVVGGSYLVTGDIRLRREAEALSAKIRCLRAAVLYRVHRHEESLADCDAALAALGGRFERPPSSSRGRCGSDGENDGDAPESEKRVGSMPPSAARALPPPPPRGRASGGNTDEKTKMRKRRKTLRRLFLLRGRVLSALGRHRDAAEWIESDGGGDVLLQSADRRSEASAHRFLHRLSSSIRSERDDDDGFGEILVPSDARLWPRVIAGIDRRLGEGMPGRTGGGGIGGGNNGGTAVYRMLRHGPVPLLLHRRRRNGVGEEAARP